MEIAYSANPAYEPDNSLLLQFRTTETEESRFRISSRAAEYINKFVDMSSEFTEILTTSRFSVDILKDKSFTNFVAAATINNIRHLNKFFEVINQKLPYNGIFIGCAETISIRRRKRWDSRHPPKLFLSMRAVRIISLPEILGRLISCGFEIIDYKKFDNLLYYVVKKIKEPSYIKDPSYGPIINLKRIGQGGKVIHVRKIRTMHAYAEYLQNFVYEHNALKEGGKFNDDFRITSWGKILRKFWIDELPMIINYFKGDIKLVGVRPISEQYFNLYPEDHQKIRIKFKPGLIPPYYADMPRTLSEVISSEQEYLKSYEKNPIRTDIKYFFKVGYNIFIKGVRSS